MVISLLQPYFFPYLGYFQLIAGSDVFVIYDDAQFMKNGWVNRNRIVGEKSPEWFTFPVEAASHKLAINERTYVRDTRTYPALLLANLHHRYRRAPHFEPVMRLVEDILAFDDRNVSAFNVNLLRRICRHLEIHTRIEIASALRTRRSGGAQGVVDVCRILGGTHYLNPIGGTELYASTFFEAQGLVLEFLQPEITPYRQFDPPFQPALSIIDALMFNDLQSMRRLLSQYRIVRPGGPG
jgi:hypothetical protein